MPSCFGVAFCAVAEADGDALRARAAGAADAVDVGLGLHREIEVKDVGDAVDIEAAGCDVGGDEDA